MNYVNSTKYIDSQQSVACLFYSELRLGLASVGVSDLGSFSRSRLNAGAEDVDDVCSAWRANVDVDRFKLNEELMSRTRGYALFIFHGRTK